VQAVVSVRATTVQDGTIPEQLMVTGHTEALARERIVSPIAGKLLSITGVEGAFIKEGEVLATIQSKESQASETGAEVMMADAKTPAERAEAERMLALAKKGQNGVAVRARISGLIATRSANSGEFVSENQELLSIVSPSEITFVADVPMARMNEVRIGEPAIVSLPMLPNQTLSASVYAIKPQADSTGQAAHVVFMFGKLSLFVLQSLRTGIVGSATITFDVRHHAMLVPKAAIIRNDETNERSVMTFGTDSIAHSIDVTPVTEVDSLVAVESDELKPGMNVITEGNYALTDSTRITIAR